MLQRYFDNAATTPLDPRVREAMLPYLGDRWGNANSIHSLGLASHDAIEQARTRIADLIGADDPSQIFFTSGATESNNWVLNDVSQVTISPFEHSAMREPALRKHCTFLEHDGTELFRASLPTQMISVMAVNNEIGTQWNALDYASAGTTVHSDATQAIGKLPFSVEGLDFVSASSHKFYGPKGAGFLFCREFPPPPLILGGEQELGMRGGTLNVAGIVGMGEAARIASEEMANDIDLARSCKAAVLSGLDGLSDMLVHGGPRTSPYILSVSFGGVEGESVVLEADSAGYAISAGAACSSRSTEPSHVLTALGIPPEYLRGTLRISFGRFSDVDEAARLAKKIRETVEMFRTL